MKRSLSVVGLLVLLLAVSAVRSDTLRNVEIGETIPPFTLRTLSGEELDSKQFEGKVAILVYVSAEQQSSDNAMRLAATVGRELRLEGLELAFLTADATRVDFFRQQRDRLQVHEFPLAIDAGRRVYGDLGLIVLPTTVVIDRDGRLAHVISSCKSDYEPVLRAYARHALGLIDDAQLEVQLTTKQIQRDQSGDRIARRRAAARLLRKKDLLAEAESELRAALEIDANDAAALLDLATLYIEQERLDEADDIVARVATAHPDDRRAKLVAGILLYHRDQIDEAGVALQEVLLLNPDPIWTHYYLGLIKERQGDEAAAITHYKESLGRLLKDHPL
jgi:peroxiredoxin